MTPMMEQYFQIKEQYRDFLLFYRLGDFYEMFFDDAILASRELELTLTGRDCGEAERAPMCGVPFHSSEGYIGRLIEKGYKVAICEQTEDPAQAKGLVKRDIIRVITPGTVDSSMLEGSRANYISAIYMDDDHAAICFCDITTGKTHATAFSGKDLTESVHHLILFLQSARLHVVTQTLHNFLGGVHTHVGHNEKLLQLLQKILVHLDEGLQHLVDLSEDRILRFRKPRFQLIQKCHPNRLPFS